MPFVYKITVSLLDAIVYSIPPSGFFVCIFLNNSAFTPPHPYKSPFNSHLSFILIFVCLPRAAMTPILHNAKRKSEYSFSPLCVFFVPLLQQGSTLLQLSRQVQPVRIAGARYSLAPDGEFPGAGQKHTTTGIKQ